MPVPIFQHATNLAQPDTIAFALRDSAPHSNGASNGPTDPRVFAAVESYLRLCEAGTPLDVDAFVSDHPEIAAELRACLAGLAFLQKAAPNIELSSAAVTASATMDDVGHEPLGDYRLIRELGRGGMGIVYEAEQLSLSRRVALKILPFAAVLDPRHLQRFKNEALAAAHLAHPHIVDVYGIGCERSIHFYAMRLIEGQTLAAVIEALRLADAGTASRGRVSPRRDPESAAALFTPGATAGLPSSETPLPSSERPGEGLQSSAPLTTHTSPLTDTRAIAALSTLRTTKPRHFFRRVAELGIQAAEALDHAHQMGIVHRDIKPSNLMIETSPSPYGRGQGEGASLTTPKLWITDFGLARIQSEPGMTMTGDLLGTLRYMSPEQALAKRITVDHRTDIYSLGITLYELLALQPAFDGRDREEVLRQIAFEDPPPLRRLKPAIPVELETIIHKAIAKNPDDRYATARELAQDLTRFCAGQPIHARRPSFLDRTRRWGRRHVAAVMSLIFVLAVSLTVSAVALALIFNEQSRTNDALRESQANLDVAVETVDDLYLNFAVEWMASETTPTTLQQQFLEQAADFYRRIVAKPADTAQGRFTQASAYGRIGELEKYLENYEEALDPLEESVAIGRRLLEELRDEVAYGEAVTRTLYSLGAVQRELSDLTGADNTYQEALHLLASLPINKTVSDRQIACQLEHAHVKQRRGKLAEALDIVQRVQDQLYKQSRVNEFWPLPLITCRYRRASILVDQNLLAQAQRENEQALSQCQGMRGLVYQDARSLVHDEINLLAQAGDIASRQGQFDDAVPQYRAALELLRQSLRAQRAPDDFLRAKLAGGEKTEAEAGPFCRYVEIQLLLCDALRRAGRHYEAELELGKCEFAARLLTEVVRPDVLRYRAAHANVWAAAAQLLATTRPDEGQSAERIAARIWLDALRKFPHARAYVSGVHHQSSDLEWFQDTFTINLATDAATQEELKNACHAALLIRHADAVSCFQNEQWPAAVRCFEHSAKLRKSDRAYDWLYIAMSRARLGHVVQAKSYFDASAAEIDGMEAPPAELIELRDQAKQLVTPLKMPESYYKFDRVFVEPDAHGLAAARQIQVGPDGNVYVANHDTDVVKVFDPNTGELLRDIGTSGGELDGPWAMTFGPDGKLYVSGRWSRNIVRFDSKSDDYQVLVSSKSGGLGAPRGIAIGPDGNVYVSSHVEHTPYSTDTVKRYNGVSGAYLGDFVAVGSGGLDNANAIAFGPDGHLYVPSANSGAINVYDGATGGFLNAFLSGNSAEPNAPVQIEFHDDGPLYVGYHDTPEVKRLDAQTGNFVDLVVPDGLEKAELISVSGFAFDHEGRLYVSAGTGFNKPGSRVLRYALKQHSPSE